MLKSSLPCKESSLLWWGATSDFFWGNERLLLSPFTTQTIKHAKTAKLISQTLRRTLATEFRWAMHATKRRSSWRKELFTFHKIQTKITKIRTIILSKRFGVAKQRGLTVLRLKDFPQWDPVTRAVEPLCTLFAETLDEGYEPQIAWVAGHGGLVKLTNLGFSNDRQAHLD